jgi:hypothetical protein
MSSPNVSVVDPFFSFLDSPVKPGNDTLFVMPAKAGIQYFSFLDSS